MNLAKINLIAYKAVCIICCAAFLFIGLKILSDNLYVKGMVSLICAAIFSLIMFQKPALRTWLQVIAVIITGVMIIGELARI
ncbi:hypothetical protein [Mucilaginibacter gotjawali]|uniref:Lysylphosphatidylglycerol synthetase-like protein (DUF2156 family) n=2 Tax=Mucilaginibacter gotjawali TaxID=1550579 RepID=A0A839SE61_9SPHI|nr:hypothetical protein [Mucilaginibacter gotjawali]MBB3056565.1 lysylphosphatidylglycerol synthetase-like protein (DUF2156 family) [Mucilaginibacter gotjawali]BAU52731.1 hypothetical protein MgSA37_00894 [Mucilaginibacter gotjawali]